MAFKEGDCVRVINQMFRIYGAKGKIVGFTGNYVEVEVEDFQHKIEENPTKKLLYYSTDLKKVG